MSSGQRGRESAAEGSRDSIARARERIVPMIARAFRRYGYEGTSLSVLSAETGLGRSSLYHYFPGGKADMAMAVLGLAERSVRDVLMASLSDPTASGHAVDTFIGHLRDYYDGGTIGCLYGVLTLHDCPPPIGARVAALTRDWMAGLAAYLVVRGDPEAQGNAEKLIRHLQGGLVVALATRDPEQFEAALRDMRSILVTEHSSSRRSRK